jgi:hypothetical protein
MPIEVIASMSRIAASTSAITQPGTKGTIDHAASAGATETTGARKKSAFEAPDGTICSFSSSLMASAMGWRIPL